MKPFHCAGRFIVDRIGSLRRQTFQFSAPRNASARRHVFSPVGPILDSRGKRAGMAGEAERLRNRGNFAKRGNQRRPVHNARKHADFLPAGVEAAARRALRSLGPRAESAPPPHRPGSVVVIGFCHVDTKNGWPIAPVPRLFARSRGRFGPLPGRFRRCGKCSARTTKMCWRARCTASWCCGFDRICRGDWWIRR